MDKIFDLSLLKDLISQFMAIIPNIIGAIVVFIIGWIIAKIGARIVKKLLVSIQIDKLAEKLNEIEIVSKANFKIVPSSALSKLFYYILLLIFVIASTDVLGMESISNLMSDLINYIPNVLSALLVLVIGLLVADFIKNIVQTSMQSLGVPSAKLIASILFYFLLLTVIMSALSQAKIETQFMTDNLKIILGATAAAFALGYGFASRDLMANFIASFYTKGKVNVGDFISIDGKKGKIISMDSTSLTLLSNEKQIIIPLSKLTSNAVEIYKT